MSTITAEQLAAEIGVSGKTLRAWLRRTRLHSAWDRWIFSPLEADAIRQEFGNRAQRTTFAAPPVAGRQTPRTSATSKTPPPAATRTPRSRVHSDEAYVLDLCEQLLGELALRQHRFDWLRGDPGRDGRQVRLPVDGYFPSVGLVVEYRERQHTEAVPHFDKPDQLTVSGVSRGQQRRLYDERREREIPAHGLRLVVIDYSDLLHDGRGRLRRERSIDGSRLRRLLGVGLPGD